MYPLSVPTGKVWSLLYSQNGDLIYISTEWMLTTFNFILKIKFAEPNHAIACVLKTVYYVDVKIAKRMLLG